MHGCDLIAEYMNLPRLWRVDGAYALAKEVLVINMRKLKFRMWDHSKKNMVYPAQTSTGVHPQSRLSGIFEMPASGDQETWAQVTVMQYTGFDDYSGKEIFEDDILNVYDRLGADPFSAVVVWDSAEGWWGYECMTDGDIEVGQLVDLVNKLVLVAGNVYEKVP